METDKDRLNKAWEACRSWITQFDGSVTQAELEGVNPAALEPGLEFLADSATNLRVLPIWREEIKNPPVDLPVDGLVTKLVSGDVLALTVNYDIIPQEDPVGMHLSVYMQMPGEAGISASWWADQVFVEEEPFRRFESLFGHLLMLQDAFSAHRLFIGPEAADQPGDHGSLWVEV